jgi:hypothetical protein
MALFKMPSRHTLVVVPVAHAGTVAMRQSYTHHGQIRNTAILNIAMTVSQEFARAL